MKLAVLVNPRARAARSDPGLVGRLAALLGTRGELVQPCEDELPSVCDQLSARGVDLVAICGGEPLAASVLLQQVVVIAPRNLTFWLSLAAALRALKSHEAELNALERALYLEADRIRAPELNEENRP